jgi:CRISPR-associated endonuclease Cas1
MTAKRADSVLVMSGYGMSLGVRHGALIIGDGIGSDRRERVLYRSERTIRRIVVLGAHGSLSLGALRWCADVGIGLVIVDSDGTVLAIGASSTHDDARLRRAQALVGDTEAGLDIARTLLLAKLDGQARVIRTHFGDADSVDAIDASTTQVSKLDTVDRVLLVEANAANAYFHAWAGIPITFAKVDAGVVPPTWLRFTQRTSPLVGGNSPRAARDPVNALLNYCYTLAAFEATLACRAVGLDPGLGVLHTDKRDRDSLAMDLLEPVRPVIDDYVLQLVKTQVFSRSDFVETRDGRCRVLPPLAGQLAQQLPIWATAVAPHAEAVAHRIADTVPGVIKRRRPLTGKPNTRPRTETRTASNARCPDCGSVLSDPRMLRCPPCRDKSAAALAVKRLQLARERWEALSRADPPPSSGQRRVARAALNRAEAVVWEHSHPETRPDPDRYRREILPGLQPLPIATIGEAIGVSVDASWRIRKGTLTPHRRHWEALLALGQAGRRHSA